MFCSPLSSYCSMEYYKYILADQYLHNYKRLKNTLLQDVASCACSCRLLMVITYIKEFDNLNQFRSDFIILHQIS